MNIMTNTYIYNTCCIFKATTTMGKDSRLQPIVRIPKLPYEFTWKDLTKMLATLPPPHQRCVPTATVSKNLDQVKSIFKSIDYYIVPFMYYIISGTF